MEAVKQFTQDELVEFADQRVTMHSVPWSHFEAILALRGNTAGPRMTYLEGELELMSPSRTHESIKTLLGRMVELYALESGVRLSGYGSWTLRSAHKERAAEPDECYIVGDAANKDAPDLVVEVVWTKGGLDKLEVYRALGVHEVWIWREGRIRMHELRGENYVELTRSAALPNLDVVLLGRLAAEEDQHKALLEFQASLKSGRA